MHRDCKLRILIVDDDKQSADLLAQVLTMLSYETTAAYSGATALIVADAYLPNVGLIDLVMRRADGYMVAAQLRDSETCSSMRLIAVTAAADEISRVRALSCGFNDVIVKPAAVSEIVAAIETSLILARYLASKVRLRLTMIRYSARLKNALGIGVWDDAKIYSDSTNATIDSAVAEIGYSVCTLWTKTVKCAIRFVGGYCSGAHRSATQALKDG